MKTPKDKSIKIDKKTGMKYIEVVKMGDGRILTKEEYTKMPNNGYFYIVDTYTCDLPIIYAIENSNNLISLLKMFSDCDDDFCTVEGLEILGEKYRIPSMHMPFGENIAIIDENIDDIIKVVYNKIILDFPEDGCESDIPSVIDDFESKDWVIAEYKMVVL